MAEQKQCHIHISIKHGPSFFITHQQTHLLFICHMAGVSANRCAQQNQHRNFIVGCLVSCDPCFIQVQWKIFTWDMIEIRYLRVNECYSTALNLIMCRNRNLQYMPFYVKIWHLSIQM